MSEETGGSESQAEREIDPYQALDAMASQDSNPGMSGTVMDSESALEAMADGEFADPSDAPPPPPPPPSGEDDEDDSGVIAFADDDYVSDVPGQGLSVQEHTAQRQAARAAREHHTTQAHAMKFKKTLIPVLLAVGGLLLVLSSITIFMLINGTKDGRLQGTMLSEHGPMVVMVACPLAAILMAGAWWFHRETAEPDSE